MLWVTLPSLFAPWNNIDSSSSLGLYYLEWCQSQPPHVQQLQTISISTRFLYRKYLHCPRTEQDRVSVTNHHQIIGAGQQYLAIHSSHLGAL